MHNDLDVTRLARWMAGKMSAEKGNVYVYGFFFLSCRLLQPESDSAAEL